MLHCDVPTEHPGSDPACGSAHRSCLVVLPSPHCTRDSSTHLSPPGAGCCRGPRHTSTSPVSFSFSTKLRTSVSGPASRRRWRGQSAMESFWKSTANRNRHGSSEAEPAVPAWHSRGPASVYITFQRKHNSGWTPRYKDWEPRACLSGARMELDSARQELPDQALCSFYCPDPCWAPPRSLAACRRLYPLHGSPHSIQGSRWV